MIAERETPSAVIAERSFLVDRPVAILMVFLATVVFGFFSFLRLRMQPNCPSGEERGETVTDRRQRRGIARPARSEAKEGRGDRWLRP